MINLVPPACAGKEAGGVVRVGTEGAIQIIIIRSNAYFRAGGTTTPILSSWFMFNLKVAYFFIPIVTKAARVWPNLYDETTRRFRRSLKGFRLVMQCTINLKT